jgi:hypothetical protein
MEYVSVTYPHQRIVNIDGQEAGLTNRTLRVNRGTHTFNLGDPRDYRPKWRRAKVTETTPERPMEVTFEEL